VQIRAWDRALTTCRHAGSNPREPGTAGVRPVRTYVPMRYLYMVIERDPEHAWLVVRSERREVELGDGVTFQGWARGQTGPPQVEFKLLCQLTNPEDRRI
jgi:hypothetical protein